MFIGILIFLILLIHTFIFCAILRESSYDREISDREQEIYLRNWAEKKK